MKEVCWSNHRLVWEKFNYAIQSKIRKKGFAVPKGINIANLNSPTLLQNFRVVIRGVSLEQENPRETVKLQFYNATLSTLGYKTENVAN